jgi:hypothetical protein
VSSSATVIAARAKAVTAPLVLGNVVVATGLLVPVVGAATATEVAVVRPAFWSTDSRVVLVLSALTVELSVPALADVVATEKAMFTEPASRWRPDAVASVTDVMIISPAVTGLKMDAKRATPVLNAAASAVPNVAVV